MINWTRNKFIEFVLNKSGQNHWINGDRKIYAHHNHYHCKIKTWSTLKTKESSFVVRSSIFWLIATPIMAKLLEYTNSHLTFNLFEEKISISTVLPFSWSILFFCALSYAIARSIYEKRCPTLIRDYKNAADYIEKNNSSRLIEITASGYISSIALAESNQEHMALRILTLAGHPLASTNSKNTIKMVEVLRTQWTKGTTVPDSYMALKNTLNNANPVHRYCVNLLHKIGDILLLVLLLQNTWFVLKTIGFPTWISQSTIYLHQVIAPFS